LGQAAEIIGEGLGPDLFVGSAAEVAIFQGLTSGFVDDNVSSARRLASNQVSSGVNVAGAKLITGGHGGDRVDVSTLGEKAGTDIRGDGTGAVTLGQDGTGTVTLGETGTSAEGVA